MQDKIYLTVQMQSLKPELASRNPLDPSATSALFPFLETKTETRDGHPETPGSHPGRDGPLRGPVPKPNQPRSQRWLKTPYRTLLHVAPTMGAGGVRASEVGDALDEQRFTPPNIEARPSASGAGVVQP